MLSAWLDDIMLYRWNLLMMLVFLNIFTSGWKLSWWEIPLWLTTLVEVTTFNLTPYLPCVFRSQVRRLIKAIQSDWSLVGHRKKWQLHKKKEQKAVIFQQYLYKEIMIKKYNVEKKRKPVSCLQYGIMWYLLSTGLMGF